ncbi:MULTISPECIES: glycosyltransferase family 4 protein [Micromonospora]|uniref:Glycosyltransferase family 4 protein n=1 Tax=Micromonospora sicca TaxID=2202420 RepID=A0ABU5JKQ4_9ACTN|nr:glycosyltransferase family 4 protein [Micromonospora sp. 4G53]MDZ5493112.1 glycosyltransferase family 4 protein [Micromonospora sp. 4G53]
MASNSTTGSRGRVVMLVDNGVHGDSRVQKAARSAADAGWEVFLLGIRNARSDTDTWQIGGAEVRLLRVPKPLHRLPRDSSRSLRRPLAYPPGTKAAYRIQEIKAWQAELYERRIRAQVLGGRLPAVVGRTAQLPSRAAAVVLARWVKFRAGETHRLRERQVDPDSLLTKLPIRSWQALLGNRSWRRLDPGLWDFELAFRTAIDELEPDIIHANDFRMLGVGARAMLRARAAGRDTKLVWDAHEFVGGITGRADNPRWLPAQIAYTAEYAAYPDAVVTVSDTLAELLQETHALPERPAVVLNAPMAPPADADGDTPDLRALCGVDERTPVLVYAGAVNPSRGVQLMVEALPELPEVHVAFVTMNPNGDNRFSETLLERAVELGVGDRVHLLPYVKHWQVVPFLSAADAGVIPIHHKPNHELALITKFLEYSHARLPIVVSDVKTMAQTARDTGQGEVFRAEDLTDYVRAVRSVLADPARYRAAYDKPGLLEGWTWEAQARVLDQVYSGLLGIPAAAAGGAVPATRVPGDQRELAGTTR